MPRRVEHKLHCHLTARDSSIAKRREILLAQQTPPGRVGQGTIEDCECTAGPTSNIPVFGLLETVKFIHDQDWDQ